MRRGVLLVLFIAWAGLVGWGAATDRLELGALAGAPAAGAVPGQPDEVPAAPPAPEPRPPVAPPPGPTEEPVSDAPVAPLRDDSVALLAAAEDGTALEVFPLLAAPAAPDAGDDDDDDHTVIWQDDSGLISLQRSRRLLREVPRPPADAAPEDAARALLERAQALLAEGHLEDARFAASHARGRAPDSPAPWELLARIAQKQGDVAEAQWNLDQARRRGGRLDPLLLGRLGREAKAVGTLHRSETAHALVSAPFEVHEPTRIALHEDIERAWRDVAREFGFEPKGKVAVVLYREEEFADREHAVWWATGDYDGRVRLSSPAAGSPRGRATLLHELAHHFMASRNLVGLPAWFNEGVAQRVTQAAMGEAAIHCGAGHGFPLGSLTRGFGSYADPREARVAYFTAFHAAQRLSDQSPLAATLPRMQPGPFTVAFEAAFGESTESFVQRFDAEGR